MSIELNRNLGVKEERSFTRTIKDLKQFREEADYFDLEIDSTKGNLALQKAEQIRQFINEKFL